MAGVLSGTLIARDLFLLAGQSNMSGRGTFDEYTAPATTGIYNYGNDGQWKTAVEPIDDATGQVDSISTDLTAAVGPSLAFAIAYQRARPRSRVGLIPGAKGGSQMAHWNQQGAHERNTLYGSLFARALEARKPRDRFAGLLFAQGEADANKTLETAQLWRSRFEAMVAAWREDLDDPSLPVVFMQLPITSDPEAVPHWDEVKAQQAAVDVEGVAMVATEDLEMADALHFTTASYLTLGERFATALLGLE